MTLTEALDAVHPQFVYVSDKGDQWRITEQGDCEDFVLLVLHHLWGKPRRWRFYWDLIFRRKADIYYVEYVQHPGKLVGHAVCRTRMNQWFDIGSQLPESWPVIRDRLQVTYGPKRYTRWQLIRKFLSTKVAV